MARAPFLVVFKAPRADSHGPGRRPQLCPGESRAGPWGEGPGAPIRPGPARAWRLGPSFVFAQRPQGGGGDGLGAASASSGRAAEGLAPPWRFLALAHPPPNPPAPGPRSGPRGTLRAACRGRPCFSRLRPLLHAAGPAGGFRRPRPLRFSPPEPLRSRLGLHSHEWDVLLIGTGMKGWGGQRAGCTPGVT